MSEDTTFEGIEGVKIDYSLMSTTLLQSAPWLTSRPFPPLKRAFIHMEGISQKSHPKFKRLAPAATHFRSATKRHPNLWKFSPR